MLFYAPAASWEELEPPEVGDLWVQPAQGKPAKPVWGHAKGLRVGLPPMPGPRGLLRLYAPYLGQSESCMINFIAVEPIPKGETKRGFSELEMSALDNVKGKRLWSADTPADKSPKPQDRPVRGVIKDKNGVKILTVFVFIEPFNNGTHVYLRLHFRSDRPNEVGVSTFACEDSKELKHCILTATMGNYARLRTLYLNKHTKSCSELWPDYKGFGFTPRARFSLNDMIRTAEGQALFIAAPDEKQPGNAKYATGTPEWWKYCGAVATQYWRSENPHPQLSGMVNGRYVYWETKSPIPGGVAFENFEIVEPFRNGVEYWFGVTKMMPEEIK